MTKQHLSQQYIESLEFRTRAQCSIVQSKPDDNVESIELKPDYERMFNRANAALKDIKKLVSISSQTNFSENLRLFNIKVIQSLIQEYENDVSK